eukprot:2739142-Alexandrium_andersonii.AAC.1
MIDQWWRQYHRMGHCALDKYNIDLVSLCRQRIHSWAGHVARLPPDAPAAQALRCRSMQWW